MTYVALLIVISMGFLALAAWPRRPRSAGTRVPTPAERAAQWEVRLGQHRAEQRLAAEARAQAFDARHIVRPVVSPRLPADNVIQIRKRKAA